MEAAGIELYRRLGPSKLQISLAQETHSVRAAHRRGTCQERGTADGSRATLLAQRLVETMPIVWNSMELSAVFSEFLNVIPVGNGLARVVHVLLGSYVSSSSLDKPIYGAEVAQKHKS